ncbi:MAG TPA: glutamate--tRNA ligase family protein, partial [Dongiaceae bacterium]|nr:glutamate--tRNA ligase family protein [Dongiaceae bacterium]
LQHDGGDIIIKRKDGLYAYHLAVVIDDAAQNITHIVRGSDLLDSTPRHLHLQHLLNLPTPHYVHLPVIVNEQGQKLSKQTFAAPLPKTDPVPALFRCLQALGQQPPSALQQTGHNELLRWSIDHWSLAKVPRGMTLLESSLPAG